MKKNQIFVENLNIYYFNVMDIENYLLLSYELKDPFFIIIYIYIYDMISDIYLKMDMLYNN